jgi:hypothetical protein
MSADVLDRRFHAARKVADAVLYEGYVLYPYRASARKNQLRWQFGVLAPPVCAASSSETSSMQTEVLVDGGASAVVHVRIRALQVQARTVSSLDGPVATLDTGDRVWTSFDEAVEQYLDIPDVVVGSLVSGALVVPFSWAAGRVEEPIVAAGMTAGRVVRELWPVDGQVRLSAAALSSGLMRLTVTVDNVTECAPSLAASGRDAAMRRSMVAVHTLLAADGGCFLSVLDPPPFAIEAAAACTSTGTFPVLIDDDVVLSSPIILYDRPAVAPESEGDMFDCAEIDEILALRVLTLTDEEKREARGTDPRSAAVVDRIEAMSPDSFESLHGTFRSMRFNDEGWEDLTKPDLPWWEPAVDASFDPWSDTVWVGAVEVGKGTRVVLHPSRRSDAQDLFIDGSHATVAGVFHDVDDDVHLAVVVDDDPAAELHQWHGRYLYFGVEEVEVLA